MRGNAALEAGNQLMKWLARGGISEREFNYCADLIRAKANPNLHGLELRQKLREAESRLSKVASLSLDLSGSVGRMMVMDDDYCYVASTVMAMMSFHDLSFAERCLCNMAVDNNDFRLGPRYPCDLRRTRIKPVISKIVESVALDIANAGFDLQELPPELQVICGHVLEVDIFSAAIMTIQRAQCNVWILTDVFYVDLALWFLSHYSGTLEVSVAGQLIFRKALGQSHSRLTVLVRKLYDPTQFEQGSSHDASIRISTGDGSLCKTIFAADSQKEDVRGQYVPTSRRNLYNITHVGRPTLDVVSGQSVLNKCELNDIGATGQAMSKWLMRVPLRPAMQQSILGRAHLTRRGFDFLHPDPHPEKHPPFLNLGQIFSRVPAILRQNFGITAGGLVVFKAPEPEELDLDIETQILAEVNEKNFIGIGRTMECFPQACALIDSIRERCSRHGCQDCEESHDVDSCRPGCLGEAALTALLTVIAHAIAEGFGVRSASGLTDERLIKWSMAKLLHELTFRQTVLWDTWFTLAAIVHLGCPWHEMNFNPPTADSGVSCISGVQYGSSVIVAHWTDLTSERTATGCFGADFADGYHIKGLSDNFAIVQFEGTQLQRVDDNLYAGDSGKWSITLNN